MFSQKKKKKALFLAFPNHKEIRNMVSDLNDLISLYAGFDG